MTEKFEFSPVRQVPRITVSFDEKVNAGNYESKGVFVSFSMDLPEGFEVTEDNLREAYKSITTPLKVVKDEEVAKLRGVQERPNPAEEVKKPFNPSWKRK